MVTMPLPPPRPTRTDGGLRRVGVEIEFAGLDCAAAARLIRARFGGSLDEHDAHAFSVEGTRLGRFLVELDMTLAHKPKDGGSGIAALVGERIDTAVRSVVATVGERYMPNEIACPPVEIARLVDIDELIVAMRAAGAVGTGASLAYAFGVHLNPEIPGEDAATLTAFVRAYALLAPWLRREIDVDVSRRLAPYVRPYPEAYVRRIADPGYRPDLATLLDDYLEANPTRNRELDLHPLFAWLLPDRMAARTADIRVRPRPTFHYRLPNSAIDDPAWSVAGEWNRWLAVERLADDERRLDALAERYLATAEADGAPAGWADEVPRWLG